jgi:hypothetical protein
MTKKFSLNDYPDNEYPNFHCLNVDLACIYGVEEALILQMILHFMSKNLLKDEYLTSLIDIAGNFPYLSAKRIKEIIDSLKNQNVLTYTYDNIDFYMKVNLIERRLIHYMLEN